MKYIRIVRGILCTFKKRIGRFFERAQNGPEFGGDWNRLPLMVAIKLVVDVFDGRERS